MLKKRRVLAVKHEAVVGTPETLDATDAAMNIYDPVIQANVEVIARPTPNAFGQAAAVFGARGGTATFRTMVEGDGAGGVPLWAARLLPACGWAEIADIAPGVFTPRTLAPLGASTDVKTATIGCFQGGVYKQLAGAMGSFEIDFMAGKPVSIDWTFQGVFTEPTDVPIISPVYPTNRPIRFANGYAIGGVSPACTSQVKISSGNDVKLRPCAGEFSGYEAAIVSDRNVTATLDPESQLVGTDNTFGKWLAGNEESFQLSLIDDVDIVLFAGAKLQRTNIQEGERVGLVTDETTAQFNSNIIDDEFSIRFTGVSS